MSIYPGISLNERSIVQKLQDTLWNRLDEDEGEIEHAWIAATEGQELRVVKNDRVRLILSVTLFDLTSDIFTNVS